MFYRNLITSSFVHLSQSSYVYYSFTFNQVFLLVHSFEANLKGRQNMEIDIENTAIQSDTKELQNDSEIHLNSDGLPNSSPDGVNCSLAKAHSDNSKKSDDKGIEESNIIEGNTVGDSKVRSSGDVVEKVQAGAHWDIFRHEDIPKLMEYISMHWEDFGKADNINDDSVSYSV